MRVLLDENLPVELAGDLSGHQAETVSGLGWEGIRNGELIARTAGRFDALLTMDRNLEFQQPLAGQPLWCSLVRSASTVWCICGRSCRRYSQRWMVWDLENSGELARNKDVNQRTIPDAPQAEDYEA